jgi:hypothetical protein
MNKLEAINLTKDIQILQTAINNDEQKNKNQKNQTNCLTLTIFLILLFIFCLTNVIVN